MKVCLLGQTFIESERRLVPMENAGVPVSEAPAPRDSDSRTVITITMEGGVIHEVEGIPHDITVRVIDFDIEGADPESITTTASSEKVRVSEWQTEGAT